MEVINIPFDTSYLEEQRKQLDEMQRTENIKMFLQQWPWLIVILIFIALFISLQRIISQASMTRVSIPGARARGVEGLYDRIREEEALELGEEGVARDRVEQEVVRLASQSPDAVAKIIKGWLAED